MDCSWEFGELLGPLGALLGWSWGGLGQLLEPSWGVLGRLGVALGSSWDLLERSKIDQKIDRKIDPKSSRIRYCQKRSGATPADISELERAQTFPDEGAPKNYLSGYPSD